MRHIYDIVSFNVNVVNEEQTAVTGSVTLRGAIGKLSKPAEWNKTEAFLDPTRTARLTPLINAGILMFSNLICGPQHEDCGYYYN